MVMCVHFIKKEEKRVGYYIHRFAKKANDLFSLPPQPKLNFPVKPTTSHSNRNALTKIKD